MVHCTKLAAVRLFCGRDSQSPRKNDFKRHFLLVEIQNGFTLIYSIKTENVLSNSFETRIVVKQGYVLSTTFFVVPKSFVKML